MREMATCRVPMARVLSSNQRRIRRFPIRPFDPTSERLQPIQSSRTEYDFRAALSEHDRSGFTYAAACSRMLSELAPVMTTTLSLIPWFFIFNISFIWIC